MGNNKKGNPFKEFLNECSEWHALWLGMAKAFIKFNPEKLPKDLQEDIEKEYHYHLFGFFLARIIQIGGLAFLIMKMFIIP